MRKILIIVLIATALAYAGSFRCGWHLDDRHTITQNDTIDHIPSALRNLFAENRGLVDLTFTLNHLLAGDSTALYHLVNLVIHLGNGLLLFLLFSRLGGNGPFARRAALAGAALFLLHPLATNAVTYVVQRYTSSVTFFYLLSLLLYLKGREGERRAAILSWVAALAAARSKEIALTLPLAVLFLEWVFPVRSSKRRFLGALPYAAVVAVIPLTLIIGRAGLGESLADAMSRSSRETPGIGRGAYLTTQIHVVTLYLRLFLLPRGLTLDHDMAIRHDPYEWDTLVRALLLVGIAGSAVYFRKKNRLYSFGMGWFFLTLLVESSIIPIRDVIFEHRTYLPSAGFFTAVAALFLTKRLGPLSVRFVLAVLIFASLGFLTFQRNRVWVDEVTLWSDCVAKAPAKARPRANLGYALLDAGESDLAARSFEKSLALGSPFAEEMVTLAEIRYRQGDRESAEDLLRQATSRKPGYGRAHRNLAFLLAESGQSEEARIEAETAVRFEPGYIEGWTLLSRLRREGGDMAGAEEADRQIRSLRGEREDTGLSEAIRLARDFHEKGDYDNALRTLEIAMEQYPDEAELCYYAAAIRFGRGGSEEAVALLRRALMLEPAHLHSRLLLARALHVSGKPLEALREAERASRENPDSREARELLESLRDAR